MKDFIVVLNAIIIDNRKRKVAIDFMYSKLAANVIRHAVKMLSKELILAQRKS